MQLFAISLFALAVTAQAPSAQIPVSQEMPVEAPLLTIEEPKQETRAIESFTGKITKTTFCLISQFSRIISIFD